MLTQHRKQWGRTGIGVGAVALGLAVAAAGASLDSPAEPGDPGSAMYTLDNIYQRLDTGAAGVKRAGAFAEPAAGPTAGTMRTTDEIMAKAPATNANAAADADVMSGKVYWSLKSGAWGQRTGSMLTRILTAAGVEVAAGYYAATNLALVEPNLATANIRGGASIFGVAGTASVMDTTAGTVTTNDMLTGKKAYAGGTLVTGNIGNQTLAYGNSAVAGGLYGATNLAEVDTNLAAANIRSGAAIFGVAGDNTNLADTSSGNAAAGDIVSNKVAWAGGVVVTGAMAALTFNPALKDIGAGFYAATNLAAVDTNLISANIATNVSIFGMTGAYETVVIAATLAIPKTGQTDAYSKTGSDGDLEKGLAWTSPRFSTSQGDPSTNSEIVVDYLTRLSWPYNWQSGAGIGKPIKSSWYDAVAACTNFHLGGYDDWRLPNVHEFYSLLYWGSAAAGPALCNRAGTAKWSQWNPFGIDGASAYSATNGYYWTSTTLASDTNKAWYVNLNDGASYTTAKTDTNYCVIPVRGWPRE